jgi:phage head maturation protease
LPKRIVTVIAMPYEQPTTINEPGRSYQEVVSRSAFSGIEKQPRRIKVNRDHSWDKPVGKVVALHPSRQEGLVAEIKITGQRRGEFPLGDATLDLCDDGILDASAGFCLLLRDDGRVYDDAEVWERNGTVRRLNRLYLDHVAFVPNPAYPGAAVIDVRDAPVLSQEPLGGDAAPNRDKLVLQDLRAEALALNSRWAH